MDELIPDISKISIEEVSNIESEALIDKVMVIFMTIDQVCIIKNLNI